MTRLRAAARSLSALTPRGRAFLFAAALALLAAVLLGDQSLLRVCILLLALPLACLAVISRTRYRLRCVRSVSPVRLTPGGVATVSLGLENLGRLPTSSLLLEDTVPFVLGSRPRFVLARLGAGTARSVSYTVRSDTRGRYRLGPLTVRLRDPFGCCEVTRSFASSLDLVVTPAVVALPSVVVPGGWGGLGDDGAGGVGSTGEDDATVRAYRQGDDLRRIHWASTARTGGLMVRKETSPWSTRATVLLDDRASAHRGSGAGSSFERAVTLCASIAAHLCERGITVALCTTSGRRCSPSDPAMAEALMLDLLADITPRRGATLADGLAEILAASSRGSLVAVLGLLSSSDARLLAGLGSASTPHLGVLLEAATSTGPPARQRPDALEQDRARGLLDAAGWRTVVAEPQDRPETLWRSLLEPRPGVLA